MLRNYIVIAYRHFRRNKIFTLINIAGLGIGISASLVIYLIVSYELSFEDFHAEKDRIYRVVSNMHFPNQDFKNSGVPGPLPQAVREEIPGIDICSGFYTAGNPQVTIPGESNEQSFQLNENAVFVDSIYFDFFEYNWLAGSRATALLKPGEAVITAHRAKLYFPGKTATEVIGSTIIYNDTIQVQIKGIVEDLKKPTDFQFKDFISFSTVRNQLYNENGYNEWGSITSNSQFFVKLSLASDPEFINNQIAELRERNVDEETLPTEHFLQPLKNIHFNPEFGTFGKSKGHKPTLYGLMFVAAFLLLLGCINFINLTTAQAGQRAQEIGIRKTMGSSKSQLRIQFLSETFFLTLVACLVSVAITPWLMRIFSDYIPEGLYFDLSGQGHLIVFALVLLLVVSFLSGFYPALILSNLQPAKVMKNAGLMGSGQGRKTWLRTSLTVFQFIIAQFFIIATIMVGKQIQFAINKDMGFNREAIVHFWTPWDEPAGKKMVLLEELRSIPGIDRISLSGSTPASRSTSSTTMKFDKDGEEIETTVEIKYADTSYFGLYGIELTAGRALHHSDTIREYVINETFAKFLGYPEPEEIVGQSIGKGSSLIPIVGVAKDFHTKSMHEKIKPLAFASNPRSQTTFHLALPAVESGTNSWNSTIRRVEESWDRIYPGLDFNYKFFDEDIAAFYDKERNMGKLLNWCSALAIFISCLGLLGLVIFTTGQRYKEIGIRKVLGATPAQIVYLLSGNFLRLVLIAIIVASPMAYWAMDYWLKDFAYRTGFGWSVFAMSALILLGMAFLTLSIQTFKSAITNPVEALRSE